MSTGSGDTVPQSYRDLPEWQAAFAVMADDFETHPDQRFIQVVEAAFRMREIERAWKVAHCEDL